MKCLIISYSLTGNNKKLAESLATIFPAEHITITETKNRTMGTIVLDILFNRTPKIIMPIVKPGEYDLIIFIGPVWMGHIATPFRNCFKRFRQKIDKYAYVSISGGADGPNPKLAGELKKKLDKEPISVIDMHIADLLPKEPKPTRDDTMKYRINESEVKSLTQTIQSELNDIITVR